MGIETTGLENRVIERRGLMLVLSSPSGAGKTTLTRLLREEEPSLSLSISMTTRQRRPSEVEGVHYHFIDKEQFLTMRDQGAFLEWAEVHGNFYGSPKKPIEQSLMAGKDVVSVFILPPSIPELKMRLQRRAEDSDEVIRHRLIAAKGEIDRWTDYDYVLVNDDLNRTFTRLKAILVAERLHRDRQLGLKTFIAGLVKDLSAF
jgi:guanylate kinase